MAVIRAALLALGAATSALAGTGDTLRSCLGNALTRSGSVAFPSDLFYQVEVNPFNRNFPVTPAAITYPASSRQVAAVIKCAVDNDYSVQARSGGHSYGNYGKFCKMCIDPRSETNAQ